MGRRTKTAMFFEIFEVVVANQKGLHGVKAPSKILGFPFYKRCQ